MTRADDSDSPIGSTADLSSPPWLEATASFLRAVDTFLFIMDPELHLGHFISGAFERVYGGEPTRFLASPAVLAEIVHPDDLPVASELILALRDAARRPQLPTGGVLQRAEIRLIDKRGNVVWNEFICSALEVADGSRFVMGLALDDTRRHQSDAVIDQLSNASSEARRSTADFLSKISHELRTPLHAMLGYAQLLEMGAGDPQDFLPRLRRAGNHVVQLLDDLLDFSRLAAGRLALEIESVPVARSIDDAIELTMPLAQEHETTVDSRTSPDVAVLGDATRLRQVVTNLITNAIKYNTTPGRVSLSVDADGETVRIHVTDTGPGIAPEDMARIFLPFDRLSAERSAVSGAGLGLPLSLGFVRAMHGDITVSSQLGAGSTFTVTLPRAADKLVPRGASTDRASLAILCIDDDAESRRILSAVLSRVDGAHISCAATATDGIAYLERGRPALLILDRHLPDMTSDELLRHIARLAPGCPVVLISSDAHILEPNSAAPPVVAALAKPLDLDQLVHVVSAILHRNAR
ncbi:MAG: ATP-binding protein [Acidimicrobiales bacterium]